MKHRWIPVGIAAAALVGIAVSPRQDEPAREVIAFQMSEIEAPATGMPVDGVSADPAIPDELRSQFEQLIRSYLLEHPEVIRAALEQLQLREMQAELDAAADAIADHAETLFHSERHMVLGNPDGTATLVEFYDYNCGYCRRAMADVKRLLETDPDLRLVMKEFPILGEGSIEAARVSVSVGRLFPDTFERFHFTLMSEPGQVDGKVALAVAEDIGIDIEALAAFMDSDEVDATINETYGLAEPLNLTGTPTFVTTREIIVGAVGFEAIRDSIAAVRASE